MNNIPYQMIFKELEKLGLEATEGVKTGIEFSFPLAIRQVMITGILDLLVGLAFVFVAYKLGKFGMWAKEKYENKEMLEMADRYFLFQIFSWLLSGLSLCSSPFLIYFGIAKLLNPKWYAIQKLIELLN